MLILLLEIVAILALVAANGLLAGTEFALVSSRKARLRRRHEEGEQGAARALEILRNPTRFLSTVQIGITAVAVAGGAFGGVRLASYLAAGGLALGLSPEAARAAGVVLVVPLVTYLMLVLGELVPKRVALAHPDAIAAKVARPMQLFSRVASPLVRLLTASTDAVLRVLPLPATPSGAEVTEEEIRLMVADATDAGVLDPAEQDIVEQLFRLSDQTAGRIMTPKNQIVWLDVNDDPEVWWRRMDRVAYTRYPVGDGALERTLGYVKIQDLFRRCAAGRPLDLQPLLRQPHRVEAGTPAFRILELFQWSAEHMAVVTGPHDEFLGIVTLHDVLQGIVGRIPGPHEVGEPRMVPREDGSWLVDGLFSVEDLLRALRVEPDDPPPPNTLHGITVEALDRRPREALSYRFAGLRIEVMDMDGRRVDKLLVTPPDADRSRSPGPSA